MKKSFSLVLLSILAIGSLLFGWYAGQKKEEKVSNTSAPQQEKEEKTLDIDAPQENHKKNSNWENVVSNGENYVTVRSIQKFYGFNPLRISGSKIILKSHNVRVEFLIGQQDVWMNKIKFVFSFPVKREGDRYLVHRIDLVKLLDPVLRPHTIALDVDTVIIDPGHGGHDSGTNSPHGHGSEKEHALTVANKLSTQLRKRGFKVGLTRSTDKFLSLQQRVDYANQYQNAVFISLHFNSGGGGRAQGIETFTLSPKGVADYGRDLKDFDFKEKAGNNNDPANIALATAIHSTVIQNTQRQDRGIRRARYSVITGVQHPAILLEGGFLTHHTEGSYIQASDYQDRLAISIADAVVKYKYAIKKRTSASLK